MVKNRMALCNSDMKARLFQRTLDSLPDGILLIGEDRSVIYHNDRFREMWSIPQEIMDSGNSLELLLFVSDQAIGSEQFRSKAESLYASKEPYEDELEFKDGRVFRRRSESLSDECFGRTRIWIFTDISEHKRAEEAVARHRDQLEELVQERTAEIVKKQQELMDSNEKYQSLSDASFEGIVITENGIIVESNTTMARMFGFSIAELIGMEAALLAAPDQRQSVKKFIMSESEKLYRSKGLNRKGSEFPVEVHGKTFEYRGRLVRVTAIRDLTEEEKADEEIQLLSGLFPICSSCKKIRDDERYWNKIESYIECHSDAKFSHSICERCAENLYGHESLFEKRRGTQEQS